MISNAIKYKMELQQIKLLLELINKNKYSVRFQKSLFIEAKT